MADVNDIITLVLDDEKLKNSSSFGGKVYTDEPILRPASALKRPAPVRLNSVPEKIKEMRELPYRNDIRWQSRERIFYEQAKLMEHYEDDCPFSGSFIMYYPTYGSMTTEQLRGYFTWRTAVRKGEYPEAPVSFVFLHIYELLNGIGTGTPEEGYGKLMLVNEHYGSGSAVHSFLQRWIKDYVIYNRLPASCLDNSEDKSFDDAVLVLMECAGRSDEEVFGAILRLSSYKIEGSTFYKTYPEEFRTVACGTYRKLSEHYGSHSKKTLCEKYFGSRVRMPHYMFASAVFYDRAGRRSFVYEVDPLHKFECMNGMWFSDMIYGSRKTSKELGELMRAVDHLMRERFGFRHRLGGCKATKTETGIIGKEIEGIFEQKKREEAAKIEIDVTKLGGIRQAADITREKLIVDEESDTEDMSAGIGESTGPEPLQTAEASAGNGTPLDSNEYRFMQCLLYGGDAEGAARAAGTMPSLIADSVNEKLFDLFADTVIDFSGGVPEIIEDYAEELKGMIHE